jgi:hypothetical protein
MELETKKKRGSKFLKYLSVFMLVSLGLFVYGKFYYVYGEGVKAGQLNYVVYKGVVFKTYEGKLIQSGFKGGSTGAIQSHEFQFSVENKEIAERLMRAGGKHVELHYKEFFGRLPWRGYTTFIVDSIISIRDESISLTQATAK